MRYFYALLFALLTVGLNAQINPKDIYVSVKKNNAVSLNINSQGPLPPDVVVFPNNYDTLSIVPVSPGQYEFTFVPETDFLGDTELTIEYFQSLGIPGFFGPNYMTLHLRVKESKIDMSMDNAIVSSGMATEIDVLANDSSSDGALDLVRLGYVEGGTASISNNRILFEPAIGSDQAYVRYFSADTTGNTESSTLVIAIEDESAQETRDIFVDNLSDIDLILPSSLFSIQSNANHGSLSQNGHVWTYEPDDGFTGLDNIIFTSASGGEISYNIEVLNKFDNSSFVVDDQYFVPQDGSITFDVTENDFRDSLAIFDYSPELTYLGDGVFEFSPPSGFTGDYVFYYKIYAAFQIHTGNIYIHVDDFAPSNDFEYDFTILNNHDLVVDHPAPITDYFFNIISGPTNGNVVILDSNNEEILECDTIQGDNTIIYTPTTDFSGIDEFTLQYCTDTGVCENLTVSVNVLNSNYSDCLCLENCVYKGDSNGDGVVNMLDVLNLGFNAGQAGPERDSDFNLFWTGQYSSDWNYSQLNSETDLKFGDTDGNGFVEANDFDEITDNYSKLHSFVTDQVGELSSVPVDFVPQNTELDSGEWLYIDIYAGSSSQPALDFYGLAFSFNINPSIMDSASVNFVSAESNWLVQDKAPLFEFNVVPVDGQVDIALTRINNASVDGRGLIGTLEFIVEDEVDGLKGSALNDYVQQQILMRNILSVDALGNYRIHPNQSGNIWVARQNHTSENIDIASQIRIYPNPATDFLTLTSEKYAIERLEVFDIMGRKLQQLKPNSFKTAIDLAGLNEGMYLLRVRSMGKYETLKFQVIQP